MYTVVNYIDTYRSQWDSFAKEYGTVFHTIGWKDVLEKTFALETHYFMAMDENNQIKAIAPIAIGRNLLLKKVGMALPFVNYLDLCAADDNAKDLIAEKITSLLKAEGLAYIELRFKDSCLNDKNAGRQEDNYTFILPIEDTEEKVMALSSSNNRNHIRKTYKNQWFTSSIGWKSLDEFYKVYSHTMKRLGSPCPSMDFFTNIRDLMWENVYLLTISDAETDSVIGGMTLFTWKDTVYYQWGGALETYNKKHVNNFMYWEAIKFCISNGYKFLDLGRSPKDSGTYNFKNHFGAEPQKLTYYRMSQKPGKVQQVEKDNVSWAIELWKKIPKPLTDIAGKILIKYVLP